MARAETRTLLSLDRWARIMGLNPLHFNGVFHELSPANTCGMPIVQYAWQAADATSREDIALAIAEAEERMTRYLRYRMAPTFEADERHAVTRAPQAELFRATMGGPSGMNAALKLDYGYVISGGIEARVPLSLNAAVAYSDTDGDSYPETATVSVPANGVSDPNEVVLVLPGEVGDPAFEVRPISVSIVASTITITARREQLVNPALFERLDGTRGFDGADASNFLTTADVYRVYLDPQQQVQLLWENRPLSCGCNSVTCSTCYLSGQFGCSLVRDGRLGLIGVQPATWNAATTTFEFTEYAVSGRAPDRVRMWYRAGWRKPSATRWAHEMDPKWERVIAYYAASLLDRALCGCKNVENATAHWATDLAYRHGDTSSSESYVISKAQMDNPLGTTRGALQAWRAIQYAAIGDSVSV